MKGGECCTRGLSSRQQGGWITTTNNIWTVPVPVKPRGATPIADKRHLINPTSEETRRALTPYFRKVRALSQHKSMQIFYNA